MKTSSLLLLSCFSMLIIASVPLNATAAEALRFRHVQSLYTDDQGIGLSLPQGVACVQDSVLVVADTGNDRLVRYTLTDDPSKTRAAIIKPPAMVYPQRIRSGPQGDIYVLDGKLRRVMHLSSEGKHLGFIDPVGMPLPDRTVIRSFAYNPRGDFYFLDILSKRVLLCNARGEYRQQIPFPQAYGFFSDLAVDARDTIFLIDSINAQVFVARSGEAAFSPLSQNLKEYMRFPTNLILDPQGRIYLTDRNGSKIVVLAQDGSYVGKLSDLGWKEGLLNHPAQVCLNGSGGLAVADTSNNRIQIFVELK